MSMNSKHVRGERLRTPVVGKSKTKQSFKKECDINEILAKYQRTGALSHFNQHSAEYGFATSLDFAESMRVVKTGQEMFDALPSSVRNRFGNDPAAFLEFVQDDEKNHDEMVELGLIKGAKPDPEEEALLASKALEKKAAEAAVEAEEAGKGD